MRVIAGLLKGRRLERVDTSDIRPTSDMVKEALFSILSDKVINCSFLDLFAGSGSVGIEAFSRGADEVVFIDSSSESIKVLKRNLNITGLKEGIEVYNTEYSNAINKLGSRSKKFDIIFIDPPYNKCIPVEAMKRIFENNVLSQNGIIVVEHDIRDSMPEEVNSFILHKRKKYGNTHLSFYMNSEDDRED